METEGEAEAEQSGGEEDAGAAVTQVDDAEETEFQLLGTRPTAEYFGQLESGTSSTFHGTDMLESEDEYVDEYEDEYEDEYVDEYIDNGAEESEIHDDKRQRTD